MGVYNDRGVTGTSSVSRATDDGHVMDLRMTRDGAAFSAEWVLGMCMEGRVFCAQAGLLTTPITWTATATNDQTKPAMFLDVPAGTTVIPLEISLYMEAYGTNALFECAAVTGTGAVDAGSTAGTITNMRSDAPYTSNCTFTSDGTGGTAPTANISSFWKDGLQKAVTLATADDDSSNAPNKFTWRWNDAMYVPVVVGAGQLLVTQGSQAGTGFGTIIFVEIPSTSVV